MAGRRFVATRDSIATAAATQKVAVEIGAPSNKEIKVYHWSVTAQGTVSNATPYLLQLIRATATITGSTGSITAMPLTAPAQSGLASTVTTSKYLGTGAYPHGGTAQDPLFNFRVPPTTGIDMWYPEGKELIIWGGLYMWWVATAAADVNLTYVIEWDE